MSSSLALYNSVVTRSRRLGTRVNISFEGYLASYRQLFHVKLHTKFKSKNRNLLYRC